MEVSIIIPTYNRNSLLYKHLAIAFNELKGMDYELIVVNDSKTNPVEIAPELQSHVRAVDNPKKGVASARNLGFSLAKSDKLIFIDDDMIINRAAVERAIRFIDEYPDACLNVNWIYPEPLQEKLNDTQFGRYLNHYRFTTLRGWLGPEFEWRENEIINNAGVASPFLVISRDCFTRTGGYDENFPFSGFEDYDFGKRLEKAGIRSLIDTAVLILHNEEDRVALEGWMQRKYRGGQTRRVAVNAGHKELATDYDNFKGKIYAAGSRLEFAIKAIMKVIPNQRLFDPLYFRLVNFMLGLNSYKGYTKKQARE